MRTADVARHTAPIRAFVRCCLACLLLVGAPAALAENVSDLLILLDADGRHYTAQQTLASEGDLLVVPLPADRISLETRFSGPEWLTFASAHDRDPEQMALWSGSVLTRYRHRYGSGLTEPEPGIFELTTRAEHAPVRSDDPDSLRWTLTWVLPGNAQLLAFDTVDEEAGGRWSSSGSLISYQQDGGLPPVLTLRFSLQPLPDLPGQTARATCRYPDALSDACSPDIDGDEVPDYRDICLPDDSKVVALTTPEQLATPLNAPLTDPLLQVSLPAMGALGCNNQSVIFLSDVRFESGQSYLNVTSRRVLDRVARSLQRLPDTRFELGVHTDNAGRVEHNQSLSDSRARTLRHYLMLRGVPGTQLEARGFGESQPRYDAAQAAGRRANRRVELRALTD